MRQHVDGLYRLPLKLLQDRIDRKIDRNDNRLHPDGLGRLPGPVSQLGDRFRQGTIDQQRDAPEGSDLLKSEDVESTRQGKVVEVLYAAAAALTGQILQLCIEDHGRHHGLRQVASLGGHVGR